MHLGEVIINRELLSLRTGSNCYSPSWTRHIPVVHKLQNTPKTGKVKYNSARSQNIIFSPKTTVNDVNISYRYIGQQTNELSSKEPLTCRYLVMRCTLSWFCDLLKPKSTNLTFNSSKKLSLILANE